MKKRSYMGKTYWGKECWNCGLMSEKTSFVKTEFTDWYFHCKNFIQNYKLTGGKSVPIQTHLSYPFSGILKDNKNCQEEYRNLEGPRYEIYTREQILELIPEVRNQIPAAFDFFLDACQDTIKNICNQSSDIVSTFPYVILEYSILEVNRRGCTRFRKALKLETITRGSPHHGPASSAAPNYWPKWMARLWTMNGWGYLVITINQNSSLPCETVQPVPSKATWEQEQNYTRWNLLKTHTTFSALRVFLKPPSIGCVNALTPKRSGTRWTTTWWSSETGWAPRETPSTPLITTSSLGRKKCFSTLFSIYLSKSSQL